jgi:adenosylhomocysteine nucleosidase
MSFFLFVCAGLAAFLRASPSEGVRKPVTGVLGAMTAEVETLQGQIMDRKELKVQGLPFVTGTLRGRSVVLAKSGVGKVNAAMTVTLMLERFSPEQVVFTGSSGGVNPALKPGDIVIGTKTVQHDHGVFDDAGLHAAETENAVTGSKNPLYFPGDELLIRFAEDAARSLKLEKVETDQGPREPRIAQGVIATGDVFVASGAKGKELRKTLQADAVEMEGAAVAQVCWEQRVPCLVIRSVSDSADEHASKDFPRFLRVASRNSAALVSGIVAKIGKQ